MKTLSFFLIIFLFLGGCSHIQLFKNWDTKDTAMMATSLGLTFVDYRMTLDLANRRDEGYYEKYNSVGLGKYPSQGRINTWFLCSAFTKTLIASLLPKNENAWLEFGRESWLTLNIGISGGLIYRNFEIGLEINF